MACRCACVGSLAPVGMVSYGLLTTGEAMGLTLAFLYNLVTTMAKVMPLFIGLGGLIALLALVVGHREGWSRSDSLYFGFITALTVGYGDLRPTTGRSKFLAIVIAVIGLITTGILVAVAVDVAGTTFHEQRDARG